LDLIEPAVEPDRSWPAAFGCAFGEDSDQGLQREIALEPGDEVEVEPGGRWVIARGWMTGNSLRREIWVAIDTVDCQLWVVRLEQLCRATEAGDPLGLDCRWLAGNGSKAVRAAVFIGVHQRSFAAKGSSPSCVVSRSFRRHRPLHAHFRHGKEFTFTT
jgi:hypothetical protein